MSWHARFKKGEFVEVLLDNVWTLGFVINAREKGYREYDIQLMTNGNIVTEVSRNMRQSNLDLGDDDDFQQPLAVPKAEEEKPTRFAQAGADDLDKLEFGAKALNTHQQTSWGVKMFKAWLVEVGEDTDFERKDKVFIYGLLKRFYGNVRNQEGQEYSKKSLLCVRASLQRYLNEPPFNVGYSIIGDPVFAAANNVLKGHIKQNKQEGLDTSTHYSPITTAVQELMYSSRVLSHDSPKALQHKVYFEVSLHFGRRAREGLHSLKKSHFVFKNDEDGNEYATLSFNPSEKNHQGLSQGTEEHSQRMYGTTEEDCPLKSLKLYLQRLSPNSESFFQTPKYKGFKLSNCWYTKSSVGINTLGKMMSTISKEAKLSQVYTNHCVRATCVTTLRRKGVASRDIKSVTGHKSEQSIEFYSKTPDHVRKDMSLKLSKRSCTSTVSVPPGPKVLPTSTVSVPPVHSTSTTDTTVSVNKVVNVEQNPQATTLFSNVSFHNCNLTVNYK